MNTQHIFRTPFGDHDLAMVSISEIDPRLVAAKANDAVLAYYAHTQAWTFPGGDALVVAGPGTSLYIFLRVGHRLGRVDGYRGIAGVFANPPEWFADALARQAA